MTAGVCEIGYNPWIYWIFGECSYTILNHTSIILGYLSIACWLNAQLPQIYQNYSSSDVDSLSPSFLIVWLFGDFTNMVGAVLTHQLPFQCYLATYFVFVDIILCIQFFYYKKPEITIDQQLQQSGIYPNSPTSDACSEEELVGLVSSSGNSITSNDDDDYSTPLNSTNPLGFSNLAITSIKYIGIGIAVLFVFGLTAMHLNVRFILAPPSEHTIYIIGRVISWVCAFLYLSSRLPQLIKNHQRKSVEGLSMFMFLFAFLGNLTYTISIVIVPHSYQSWMETLPFLIGSCGTLQFDAIMMYQFFKYNKMDRLRHRPLKSNPSSRVVTWVEDPFEAEFLLNGSYHHHSIHQHNQPTNSSAMDLKL